MPNLASLVASEGTVIVTLHHGCMQRDRRMVEMSAEETIALARQKGLRTRPRPGALVENRAGSDFRAARRW
jgi:hypothetical protein